MSNNEPPKTPPPDDQQEARRSSGTKRNWVVLIILAFFAMLLYGLSLFPFASTEGSGMTLRQTFAILGGAMFAVIAMVLLLLLGKVARKQADRAGF